MEHKTEPQVPKNTEGTWHVLISDDTEPPLKITSRTKSSQMPIFQNYTANYSTTIRAYHCTGRWCLWRRLGSQWRLSTVGVRCYSSSCNPGRWTLHRTEPRQRQHSQWVTLTFDLAYRWAFRWAKVRSKSRLVNKKAQLTLSNPRDAKACKNWSNSSLKQVTV